MRLWISIRGSVHPSVHPSVYLSIHPSIRRSVRRSVTPSQKRVPGASNSQYRPCFPRTWLLSWSSSCLATKKLIFLDTCFDEWTSSFEPLDCFQMNPHINKIGEFDFCRSDGIIQRLIFLSLRITKISFAYCNTKNDSFMITIMSQTVMNTLFHSALLIHVIPFLHDYPIPYEEYNIECTCRSRGQWWNAVNGFSRLKNGRQ